MDFALHKVQGKVCTFACTTEWRHLYDGNVFALVSREKVLISDFIYAGVMCDNQLTLLNLGMGSGQFFWARAEFELPQFGSI